MSLSTSRRTVLKVAAVSAGGLALAACGKSDSGSGAKSSAAASTGGSTGKGSAKEPLAKPAAFQESPLLTKAADAGTIPKLADRIAEEPYVIPHNWVQKGKYGGWLKMLISDTSADSWVGEWFYSHGMLRYLNDGQTIGPGLIAKWTSNADASDWSFTLRKGLTWSDGQPVTTADVLFWWNDMVNYSDYIAETPPDEARSGKGTLCKLTAADDLTFTMKFDAPAPLTADRMAMWTNGPGGNGPTWIVPAHFAKQFHPKYAKVPASWAGVGGLWRTHVSVRVNPKCPTLLPFKLTKYNEGRSLTWERNPYAYEVTKEGDQLPYIDGITMSVVQDPQVGKVQITAGKIDISHGPQNGLILADVSTLTKNKAKADLDIFLWDGGAGAAGCVFVSLDYYEKPYRDLFRNPKFRQAMSLCINRAEAKKSVFFEQGELTTGTMSPKAIEYLINDTGKGAYASWRDSYVKYDPAAANALLDGLGLKDTNNDGYREFPDGSRLRLRSDRSATTTEDVKAKDNLLIRDLKAVGLELYINPVAPTSFSANWDTGKYMVRTDWGIGDGPNHLVYPQWVVPIESSRWSPLVGAMYNARGRALYTTELNVDPWKRHPPRVMPEKGGAIQKLWDLYDTTKVEPDFMKRTATVWEMIKVHVKDGPYTIGTLANIPELVVKKTDLKNVPNKSNLALGGFADPWIHPTPAVYDPQTYYWDHPDQHNL